MEFQVCSLCFQLAASLSNIRPIASQWRSTGQSHHALEMEGAMVNQGMSWWFGFDVSSKGDVANCF